MQVAVFQPYLGNFEARKRARQWSWDAPDVFAVAQFRRAGADLRQRRKAVSSGLYALSSGISDGFAVDGRVRRRRGADSPTFCPMHAAERSLAASRASEHLNLSRRLRCQ
jgi:hypothetical protein